MSTFSQRIGKKPATKVVQQESMDADLLHSLWNVISDSYFDRFSPRAQSGVAGSNMQSVARAIWADFYKLPTDLIPWGWRDCLAEMRRRFYAGEWHEAYDFLEFMARFDGIAQPAHYYAACNEILARENAAYRFVNGLVAEITSGEEVAEIERALNSADRYAGVKTHLSTALTMMSSRERPDYRNSIKESISAVEALAKQLSGNQDGTLGAVLKALAKAKRLHPALSSAFSALYGYTNDADGIRHALLEDSTLTKADAQFMLICCSAFVNYCIASIETAPPTQ